MGKIERLELWWQLYRTSLPVRDLENFRSMDFCSAECTYVHMPLTVLQRVKSISFLTNTNFANRQQHGSLEYIWILPGRQAFRSLGMTPFFTFSPRLDGLRGFLIFPSSPPVSHFALKSTECSPQLKNRLYQLTKVNTRDVPSTVTLHHVNT